MKSKHFFPVLILMMFISGCENVSSQYLVGQKPYAVKTEEWAGEWSQDCSGEEIIRIEVLDKDKGILRLTEVKTSPGSTMESYECYLREAGNWIFANTAIKGEADFYPVRVKNLEGRQIIVWFPDPEKFKPLVFEKKVLPGQWRGRDISLGLLKPEHLELIMSGKEGVLFKWDEPSILIRYGKIPAPQN
jgi:hypothetical protein